jgi:hypothetical protein
MRPGYPSVAGEHKMTDHVAKNSMFLNVIW